jgi:ABC-type glutathione transport system ATPase component
MNAADNAAPAPAALEARRLSKSYGDVQAVRDVSFAVPRGFALGLIGESGSGKSTIARLLVGLESPDAGSIHIEGRQLGARRARRDRRAVQLIFQDSLAALNPRLSIIDSIQDFLTIHRLAEAGDRRRATLEALEGVHLSEAVGRRRPSELSGGQRQRACIARALVLEPAVLVADEPTSALDVSIQGQILNLLVELKTTQHMALVFITHDMSVVRYVADEIVVMLSGEAIERGPTECISTDPRHPYTRRLLAAAMDDL